MASQEKTGQDSWHGIPREKIEWHPTVDNELCIGCGICVIGCGPGVYKFDYEKRHSVVAYPLKCKVGCVTCENTCPTRAISFPTMTYLHKLYKKNPVIQVSRKELEDNRDKYAIS